jgi:lipopolysaccharide exporter
MPFITRIYTPEMFGYFAIYVSIVNVLFPISTLRFSSAIVLPADDANSDSLVLLSMLATLCVAIVVAILGFVFYLPYFGGSPLASGFIIACLSFSVLIQGWQQSMQFFALRSMNFGTMGFARVAEALSDRFSVLGAGLLATASYQWMILGRIVGPLMALVILFKVSNRARLLSHFHEISWSQLKLVAVRYKDFPLYSSWAFLLTRSAREMPIWILMAYYSAALTGMYALGQRLLNVPAQMIGDALAKTFMQRVAQDNNRNVDLSINTLLLIKGLTYMLAPVAFVLFFLGAPIFATVFGEEWRMAGVYAGILAPILVMRFLYRICSVFFDVLELQRERLIFDTVSTTSRFLALFIPAFIGCGVEQALASFSAVSALVYLIAVIYLLGKVHVPYTKTIVFLLGVAAVCVPLLAGIVVSSEILEASSVWSNWLMCSISVFSLHVLVVSLIDRDVRNLISKRLARN